MGTAIKISRALTQARQIHFYDNIPQDLRRCQRRYPSTEGSCVSDAPAPGNGASTAHSEHEAVPTSASVEANGAGNEHTAQVD